MANHTTNRVKSFSLFVLLVTASLWCLFPGNKVAKAQAPNTPAPDCIFFINQTFNSGSPATVNYPVNTATGVVGFDNRTSACQTWTFQYSATATSGSLTSLDFQAATGAVTPGSYSTWGGTVLTGINPNTASSGDAITTFSTGCANGMACTVANSWVKILFTRNNFVGHIQGVVYGYRTGYARNGGGGGGSGTVTEVDTGCGLSGGPITTTGEIDLSQVVNHQTGTTYAILSTDCGKLLTLSNGSAVAVSIAQAGTSGFVSGWSMHIENLGAGTVTVTPSTSTIDGAASLTLATNQGIVLFSDGTNYFTERGRQVNNGTVTSIGTGCGLSGGPITGSGTIALSQVVNAQTGATYAIQNSDCGKLVSFARAGAVSSIAVSIAQAGSGGNFVSGWLVQLEDTGTTQVDITPTTSTIDGAASLTLNPNQGIVLFSDGTNYFTNRGRGYNQIQNAAGTNLVSRSILKCTGVVTCQDLANAASGITTLNVDAGSGQQHVITFVISGGGTAIVTGGLASFPTADFTCTINRTDISADQSGSITVDIWKKAGAIPGSGDKISASAPVTLSSAQLNQNGSISGWTTAVTTGDVFGGTVASAATVQAVTVQIWCQ